MTIYFARRTDKVIKIGYTKNLGERMANYQEMVLLGRMDGDRTIETSLHKQFADYLVEGREWFSDCPAIREYIAVNTQHGIPDGEKRCTIRLNPVTQYAVDLLTFEYSRKVGKRLSGDDTLWMFFEEHYPEIVADANRILGERK